MASNRCTSSHGARMAQGLLCPDLDQNVWMHNRRSSLHKPASDTHNLQDHKKQRLTCGNKMSVPYLARFMVYPRRHRIEKQPPRRASQTVNTPQHGQIRPHGHDAQLRILAVILHPAVTLDLCAESRADHAICAHYRDGVPTALT